MPAGLVSIVFATRIAAHAECAMRIYVCMPHPTAINCQHLQPDPPVVVNAVCLSTSTKSTIGRRGQRGEPEERIVVYRCGRPCASHAQGVPRLPPRAPGPVRQPTVRAGPLASSYSEGARSSRRVWFVLEARRAQRPAGREGESWPRRAGREATSCAAKDRRGQDGARAGAADSGRCRADPPCGAAARRDGLCACARARALCGAPRAGARSVARGCARPAAGGSNARPRYYAPGAYPRSSPVAVTAAFFWGGLTPPRGLRAARCEPRRPRAPPAPSGCMRTLRCTSGTSPFHLPGVP